MKFEPEIILDCDGVLTKCWEAMVAAHHKPDFVPNHWNFFEDWGMSKEDFYAIIRHEEFWINLEPTPWFVELMEYVRGSKLPWVICTAPIISAECLSGKARWFQNYLQYNFVDKVIFMKDKWRLAHPGALLIDDHERNCREFTERGGAACLVPAPHNSNRHLVGNELRYIINAIDQLKATSRSISLLSSADYSNPNFASNLS